MAEHESKRGGGTGYSRSVRTAGRQLRGRAWYRILLFFALFVVFGAVLILLLFWGYSMAGLSSPPGWVWYVAFLVLGVWSAFLLRLFRLINVEGQRVSTLEDRELKLQVLADRYDQAHSQQRVAFDIKPKDESEDYKDILRRLDSDSQEALPPQSMWSAKEGNETEDGLRVAYAHVGFISRFLAILLQGFRPDQNLPATKSLPPQSREPDSAQETPTAQSYTEDRDSTKKKLQ
jgi:hypothetical protein